MKLKIISIGLVFIVFACEITNEKEIEFHSNGEVKKECTKLGDDKKYCIEYYANGIVKLEYNTIKGRIDNILSEYDSSGKILKTSYHVNGLKSGEEKIYNYNDSIVESFTYIENNLTGKYKKVDFDGNLLLSGSYLNGNREGFFSFYNEEHIIYEKRQYYETDKGFMVNQKIIYENGKIKSEGSYYFDLIKEKDSLKINIYPVFSNNVVPYVVFGDFEGDVLSLVPKDTVVVDNFSIVLSLDYLKYEGGVIINKKMVSASENSRVTYKQMFFKF